MAPWRRRRRTNRQPRGGWGTRSDSGGRKAGLRGCGSGAVQEALIHPRSYAPDGQGRYTTPMYFRGVSLLDSYGSFLRPRRESSTKSGQKDKDGSSGGTGSGQIGATVDNERSETPGELNAGDRGGMERGKRETESVEINKGIVAVSSNNVTFFSNCVLIVLFSRSVQIDYPNATGPI